MATDLLTKFKVNISKVLDAGNTIADTAQVKTQCNVIERTYTNANASFDYNALVTLSAGAASITLSTIKDAFQLNTGCNRISTLGFVADSANTGVITMDVKTSTPTTVMSIPIQKGAAMAIDFPVLLTAATIDFSGTTGDKVNIYLTGKTV